MFRNDQPSRQLDAARRYRGLGLSVIPIRIDGSKGSAVAWKKFQTDPADESQLRKWFGKAEAHGIAIIAGEVSDNLLVLDFEDVNLFDEWQTLATPLLAEAGIDLNQLPVVETPRPGRHVYLRMVEPPPSNDKLALDENGKTVIETRGEGGYVLAPGSPPACHPTGREYRFLNLGWIEGGEAPRIGLDLLDTLLDYCRVLDRSQITEQAPIHNPSTNGTGERPGDEFNRRADWQTLLTSTGATRVSEANGVQLWRRPGKDCGISATVGARRTADGVPLLIVHSTNWPPFQATSKTTPKGYTPFEAFTLLHHRGDFRAAARALAETSTPRITFHPMNGKANTKPQQLGQHLPNNARREPRLHWTPFPMNSLPSILREFCSEATTSIGCDLAFVALPALSVCAGLIGNTRSIRLKKDWHEPPIIWTAILGESGSHKSPALAVAVGPLHDLQKKLKKNYDGEFSAYQNALQLWKDTPKIERGEMPGPPILRRVVLSNTTIEKISSVLGENPKGVLVSRDELAGWIGSFNQYKSKGAGGDLQLWLEAHGARNWIIDRQTGVPKTIFVPHATVSVSGGIQPSILAKQMTGEHWASGFSARLLFAWPPRKPKVWSEAEVSIETEVAYRALIDGLHHLDFREDKGEKFPQSRKLSTEAKAIWVDFYNEWGNKQSNAEGDLAAAFSKLEGYAARLTLVHHVVDRVGRGMSDDDDIDEASVRAGITLAKWFAAETERIYAILKETDEEGETRKLTEVIERKGGSITARELQRSNSRKYLTSDFAEAALNSLVSAGIGTWETEVKNVHGGHRVKRFNLCPTHDTSDTRSPEEDVADPATYDTSPTLAPEPPENIVFFEQVSEVSCVEHGSTEKNETTHTQPIEEQVSEQVSCTKQEESKADISKTDFNPPPKKARKRIVS